MLLRSHCELINEDSKPLPARDRVIDRPCDLRLRYLRVADIKPMTTTYSCLLDAFSELRMAALSFSKLVWSLFGVAYMRSLQWRQDGTFTPWSSHGSDNARSSLQNTTMMRLTERYL